MLVIISMLKRLRNGDIMIQDIFPHKYNNHYERLKANESDCCICIRDGRALLKRTEAGWDYPTVEEASQIVQGCTKDRLTYAFSIDCRHYFMHQLIIGENDGHQQGMIGEPLSADDMQSRIIDENSWKTRRDMREVAPRVTAFAGITALQLDGWYRGNRFCGRCGGTMLHDKTERMMLCPRCGNHVYPRINPAVIIGITDGDRILMTKYAGRVTTRYALVAGFTEIGETLEQTVERETMEETGLRVRNIRYYKSQPWSFSDTILMGFFCEADGDTSIHMDKNELSLAQWVERSDIDKAQESYDDLSLTNEMIKYFRDNGMTGLQKI